MFSFVSIDTHKARAFVCFNVPHACVMYYVLAVYVGKQRRTKCGICVIFIVSEWYSFLSFANQLQSYYFFLIYARKKCTLFSHCAFFLIFPFIVLENHADCRLLSHLLSRWGIYFLPAENINLTIHENEPACFSALCG